MSVLYLIGGAAIGLGMLFWPSEAGYYVSSHVHLNLLGFMSMMIYGVGYHILPKFSGTHIYSPLIVKIQFWVANAGLVGMAISWPFFNRGDASLANNVLILSAILSMLSVILFAYNMLKTIKSA
jgi:heme/copper-type cytochrome/quinol oxidase subunit 1